MVEIERLRERFRQLLQAAGFIPRARGRATPRNHHQVNIEIFIEDFSGGEDEADEELFG